MAQNKLFNQNKFLLLNNEGFNGKNLYRGTSLGHKSGCEGLIGVIVFMKNLLRLNRKCQGSK